WGLTGLALLAGMGMLVVPAHLTLKGGVEEFGVDRTDEFLWFFDLPWYVWIPMVLLALLLPAAVALLWHRDRELDDGNILALVATLGTAAPRRVAGRPHPLVPQTGSHQGALELLLQQRERALVVAAQVLEGRERGQRHVQQLLLHVLRAVGDALARILAGRTD